MAEDGKNFRDRIDYDYDYSSLRQHIHFQKKVYPIPISQLIA